MEENQQGHRKRLREKFAESGLAGFHDYEIVELLLTLGSPRKDCKQQAKEAISKFKTLRGVLEASPPELQQIKGIGIHNSFGIKLVQEVARKYLKEKIIDKPVCSSSQEIYDYLYHSMRDLKKEVFKVIYLNSQNLVIETEDLFRGTVDSSVVHIREVIEAAIRYNAVSLIFVHNHPSGNPSPSQSDKDLTRDLVMASSLLGLKVLDHIVIGDNKFYSFAGEGLIEQFELDRPDLKMKRVSES
ncbi:MAG: DNA repair protein RadC [Dehalococcoidales bacterium]|jgi:DNA repair protein RadC|nr:DNA repair protein RadC [Dehalococcoidales bacterium]